MRNNVTLGANANTATCDWVCTRLYTASCHIRQKVVRVQNTASYSARTYQDVFLKGKAFLRMRQGLYIVRSFTREEQVTQDRVVSSQRAQEVRDKEAHSTVSLSLRR